VRRWRPSVHRSTSNVPPVSCPGKTGRGTDRRRVSSRARRVTSPAWQIRNLGRTAAGWPRAHLSGGGGRRRGGRRLPRRRESAVRRPAGLPWHVRAETAGGDARSLEAIGWRRPVSAGGPWHQIVCLQRPRRPDRRRLGGGDDTEGPRRDGRDRGADQATRRRFRGRLCRASVRADRSRRQPSRPRGARALERRLPHPLSRPPSGGERRSPASARPPRRLRRPGNADRERAAPRRSHPATVAAHLDANAALDGAPVTNALRRLAGGGRALCLQAKSSAPVTLLVIVLWSMIEPLLGAQRGLRSSRLR
jgi:hypothetical protein